MVADVVSGDDYVTESSSDEGVRITSGEDEVADESEEKAKQMFI